MIIVKPDILETITYECDMKKQNIMNIVYIILTIIFLFLACLFALKALSGYGFSLTKMKLFIAEFSRSDTKEPSSNPTIGQTMISSPGGQQTQIINFDNSLRIESLPGNNLVEKTYAYLTKINPQIIPALKASGTTCVYLSEQEINPLLEIKQQLESAEILTLQANGKNFFNVGRNNRGPNSGSIVCLPVPNGTGQLTGYNITTLKKF